MRKLFYLILFASATNLDAQVDLVSNLKVCMPFVGNANDISGNGNNGTVSNCTLTTDRFGNANSAYLFSNTVNSHIAINSFASLAPTNELTISMWAKANVTTSNCLFILNPDSANDRCVGCAQYVNGGSTLMIWDYGNLNSGGRTTAAAIPADNTNWHHYTYIVSQSGNIKQMYLDGVIKSNASYSLTCTNKNLPFYIGGGFSNGSTTSVVWNGKIDDVCIYNRALNANEVTVLYNGTNVCFNVGVKELEELANFQVFPTASAEGLFTALSPVKGRVEIYSAGGQFIKAYQKQEDKITIDLKNEASGVYFLRLVTGEGVYTRKLIKE